MKVKLIVLGLSVAAFASYLLYISSSQKVKQPKKHKCPCEDEQNNHTDLESLELFKAMTTGE